MPGAFAMRPAGAADAEALAALHEIAIAPSWTATEIAWMLDPPGLGLLAHDDRGIAGFVLARAVADEAEILTLAVRPDERRRGVASSLINRLLGDLRARKVAALFLEVAEDNRAALGLYLQFGFVETGRRRGYYERAGAGAADAIVMSRSITQQGD